MLVSVATNDSNVRIVAASTSCSLNFNAEAIEKAPTSQGYRDFLPGMKSWTVNVSGLYSLGKTISLSSLIRSGTRIAISFNINEGGTATEVYSGSGIVTGISIEGSLEGRATYTMDVQGCGALSVSTTLEYSEGWNDAEAVPFDVRTSGGGEGHPLLTDWADYDESMTDWVVAAPLLYAMHQKEHTHSNKAVLDGISSSDVSNWNSKAPASHSHTKSDITNFAHTHDERYYTESEMNTKLAGKSDTTHTHDERYYTESEIDTKLNGKSDTSHTHDSRYYTESEIDTKLTDYYTKQVVDNQLAGKSDTSHTHDSRYYTESEVDEKLNGKAAYNHNHDGRYYTEDDVDDMLAGKSDTTHTHDERYYTESEIDTKLNGKSNTGHTHDGRYYTESEVDTKLSGKSNTGHTHTPAECSLGSTDDVTFHDVTANGDMLVKGAFTCYTTSDRNLKRNINPIDCIEILKHTGGVFQFEYKDSGEWSIGMMAQDVQQSRLNDIVYQTEDGSLAVCYQDPKLISVCIGAILQLEKRVAELETLLKLKQ